MHPARAYLVYVSLSYTSISTIFVIYTLYLLSIGMSLAETLLVNAVFAITIVIAEVPTGMLADGRGRIWSIRVGIGIAVLATFIYAFATGLWSAMFAEAVFGIAVAFLSGAEGAWITDALDRKGEKDSLKRVLANAGIAQKFATAVGSGLGTLVSLWSFRASWILCSLLFLVTFWFTHKHMNGEDGEPLHRVSEIDALKMSLRRFRESYELKWVMGIGILFVLAFPFNHFWTPFFEPAVGRMGLYGINVFMQVAMVLGSILIKRQGQLEEQGKRNVHASREATWLVGSMLLIGMSMSLLRTSNVLIYLLGCVAIHEFGRGILFPLRSTFTQKYVDSSFRATYGSFESFCYLVWEALVYGVIWYLMRHMPATQDTISHTWLISGSSLTAIALFLWIIRPRRSA